MHGALPLTIQTRVGRRLLLLFVLSALLPIGALAALGYFQVRSQLTSQTESLLRQSAKSVGMGLLDQLRGARATLNEAPFPDSATLTRAHAMFTSMAVVSRGAPPRVLWGSVPPVDSLKARNGNVALVLTGADTSQVWMVAPAAGGQLWAEIRHDYLFEGSLERAVVGGNDTEVCVRERGAHVIGCGIDNSSGSHPISAEWELFLGYDYDATPWRVQVAQPAVSALAPLLAFRRLFLGTVVIVLGVVVIVATSQVRRSMLPLQQLQEGTQRLAKRDFTRPVPVSAAQDEFADLATSFNIMAGDLDKQFQHNTELITRLGELSYGALAALARTIDASSPWTAGHSERVTAYSLRMAARLAIDEAQLDSLKRGGLLHDIGKIGIPPQILDKPGTLDPAELARIREHPTLGAKILAPLSAFADAIPIVRSHHERYDGGGYPQGLSGENIPILARLLAVADVYDALVSSRPYRPGWKHDEALANIRAARGSHFDPIMVDAFFDVMETEGDAARFSLSMERLS